ncbi:hypothetical protein J4477_01490 [Candidatus Pacearchaeota archaeon]|nr:hypothetical protein [Candidatus Pacearchaeota archaeon]
MQKYSLEFLREFTRELVINSLPEEYKEKKLQLDKIKEIVEKEESMTPSIFKSDKKELILPGIQAPVAKEKPIEQKIYEIMGDDEKKEGFFLGKITPMILDKRVIAVECPGPGRYVIVKMPDKKLSTNIILTKENINEIINIFSEEARIPRIGGLFKAIANNLIITAIDSRIGGPKFIINRIRQ